MGHPSHLLGLVETRGRGKNTGLSVVDERSSGLKGAGGSWLALL